MKAIVFAAGLGTRLKPLTNDRPKALIEIDNKPLIWHALQNLKKWGVQQAIVNVHHFGNDVIDYLKTCEAGIDISISDERDLLLDTGGGLLKAKDFFNDGNPFFAVNVDVFSTVNLSDAMDYHLQSGALATLVVRKRETSRYFMFNDEKQLTGWINTKTGEQIVSRKSFEKSVPLAFSGIQVISPSVFDLITEKGNFSLTQMYLRLATDKKIVGYLDNSPFWIDVGKPGELTIAEKWLKNSDNTINSW
ncbi:MAG: NTP transferase domain-containing protein [Prolixibacteraceae bacterium]|nr:NTP transferase domain-containing protein [Prolixibacteraceae bacterium]